MNVICAAGDEVVLRVSTPTAPAEQALRLARLLRDAGIRVPAPVRDQVIVHEGCSVVAVEFIREHGAVDWREVGDMVVRVHRLAVDAVRGRYPLPWCGSFPWWSLDSLATEVDDLLDPAARAGIRSACDDVRDWPHLARAAPEVVCHGDVHPGNVVAGEHGPVLLDWDLLCTGPSAWDHAALLTWTERWGGQPGVYESFAEGCGWSGRGDPLAEQLARGRLLAATLMRLRAGRTDPLAAIEGKVRLAHWRRDPDAPMWSPQ
jgi:aminoglycoside phosphotransferase (APT) family kinase protein